MNSFMLIQACNLVNQQQKKNLCYMIEHLKEERIDRESLLKDCCQFSMLCTQYDIAWTK